MSRFTINILRYLGLGIASLLLLTLGAFGIGRGLSSGQVLGDVSVGPIDLGGLNTEDANAALSDYEETLSSRVSTFNVNGDQVSIRARQVGFDINEELLVQEAMRIGREGSLFSQLSWWLRHFSRTQQIEIEPVVSEAMVADILEDWDQRFVSHPPFPGELQIEDTRAVAIYPASGFSIDSGPAQKVITDFILSEGSTSSVIPITEATPTLSREALDRAVVQANQWLSGPIMLTSPGVSLDGSDRVRFEPSEIAQAIEITYGLSEVRIEISPEAIEDKLAEVAGLVESMPTNARLEVIGDLITVVAGTNGTILDAEKTADNLEIAAQSASRVGQLGMIEGAAPAVITEDIEALDIRHLVSSFTTYHNCCQTRVNNIQKFADIIDGALVGPGEDFGLNDYVGRRTADRGFQPAGTIVQGELVDTVGGGVSQFATTFYNAVYWGGYEDVEHRHHSFYFSRYPEGIEATISWPVPELTFHNDTNSTILIKTEYTDTSITVKFFSNNDGRTIVGDQKDGRTNIEVVSEGGPQARVVESEVSGRYGYTEIPEVEYRVNPEVSIGSEEEIQDGGKGWTVTVTRTVTHLGESTSRDWRVRYVSKRPIIEVHPCSVPEGVKVTDPDGALDRVRIQGESDSGEGDVASDDDEGGVIICPAPEQPEKPAEEEEGADSAEEQPGSDPSEPEETEDPADSKETDTDSTTTDENGSDGDSGNGIDTDGSEDDGGPDDSQDDEAADDEGSSENETPRPDSGQDSAENETPGSDSGQDSADGEEQPEQNSESDSESDSEQDSDQDSNQDETGDSVPTGEEATDEEEGS